MERCQKGIEKKKLSLQSNLVEMTRFDWRLFSVSLIEQVSQFVHKIEKVGEAADSKFTVGNFKALKLK